MPKIDHYVIGDDIYEIVPEIAPLFKEDTAYVAGDYVIKDAVLYRFVSDHDAGEWIGTDASATTVTDLASGLGNSITEDLECAYVTENINRTTYGVTFETGSGNTLNIYGAPTRLRRFCFLNGNNAIKTTSDVFLKTLDKGVYDISYSVSGYGGTTNFGYTYTTFTNVKTLPQGRVTFNAPVMIAVKVDINTNYGTSDNPTIISFSVKKLNAVDVVARTQSSEAIDAVNALDKKISETVFGTTDNIFDLSSVSSDIVDQSTQTFSGTMEQLNNIVLVGDEVHGGGSFSFTFDYKNGLGGDSVGPCIVGLDANGNRVTVKSLSTGTSSTRIVLTNYVEYCHRIATIEFPSNTDKVVISVKDTPDPATIFYFRNMMIKKYPVGTSRTIPDYVPNASVVDYVARRDLDFAGYVHDGSIFRMSSLPDPIPVGENALGYNEFINTTWNTLLPDNYSDGDAYDVTTTKIIGVQVDRESEWTSTPYGTNSDTYAIYRFTFTPRFGYEKTILLTAGCHGNEAEGYWGLYRLIRMIYFEGHKYPTLRNLRNCRIIVVPIWNPWGMQHYRRYNAFSALNAQGSDRAKNLQAWNWLYAEGHTKTVEGVDYDIDDVGEAKVIFDTVETYKDTLSMWLDFHTDPYAGRSTRGVDIDDPRPYEDPYGFYGYAAPNSKAYIRLFDVMYDFKNILDREYNFTQTWHPQSSAPSNGSFSSWMSTFGFPAALVEVSTFMNGFPCVSGSAEMMKLAQEFYGNCIAEILR